MARGTPTCSAPGFTEEDTMTTATIQSSVPMTFAEYVAIDRVNFSTLKEMRKSPKHYLFAVENSRKDTKRLALGRATHTAILEPDRFAIEYAVYRGGRRAGKDWDAFCAANKDRTIVNLSEYAAALGMRDSVRAHPIAGPILAAGLPEQTFLWTDPETGVECKCRPDWLATMAGCFVDVKTTVDGEAAKFGALAARYGYHLQAAFYRRGLLAHGLDLPPKIVTVEAAEPYDVAVFAVDEDALYAGDETVGELLRRVAECRASGKWPGRYQNEERLALPSWAFPDEGDAGLGLVIGREAA
jgi:hypothetical protein